MVLILHDLSLHGYINHSSEKKHVNNDSIRKTEKVYQYHGVRDEGYMLIGGRTCVHRLDSQQPPNNNPPPPAYRPGLTIIVSLYT